jgi:hypothetical protein
MGMEMEMGMGMGMGMGMYLQSFYAKANIHRTIVFPFDTYKHHVYLFSISNICNHLVGNHKYQSNEGMSPLAM